MGLNSSNLELVIDLASRRRDQAGKWVAQAQQALLQAQAQERQLLDYAQEGEDKWRAQLTQGVSVVLMQHQRAYAEKVEHALAFQAKVIVQKQQELQRAQQGLQAAELELAKLEKVAEGRRLALLLVEQRRDQRRMDEMAANMLAHRLRTEHEERAP